MSLLHTPESLAAARAHLAAADPALARIDARLPPFTWRSRPGGFAGLVRFIIEQQVSVASAAAIWGRLEAGLGEVTPRAVLARDEAELKAFGLSSPKARYVHAIAHAHFSGAADFDRLAALDDEAAITALTAIKGVGRWTAEVYLMMCEARLDVFPAGDLALQEGLRMADESEVRPTEKALYARSELWRPYRAVAAHLIWDYYIAVRAKRLPEPGR
jgi:DNA-3-methyladenine glycosylase II